MADVNVSRRALVDRYRLLYFSWKDIAEKLGISRGALSQWRVTHRYEDPLKPLSALELDAIIAPFMAERASRGFHSVKSHVRTSGPYVVTDDNIWASMKRVGDPGMKKGRCTSCTSCHV